MINIIYYLLIFIMTACGGFAGLFLKKASSSYGIKNLILNLNLYIGGVLYLFGAIMNIYVLKFLDYSIVLPLTSITYIWTMIISYFILKERMTVKKVMGILFIVMGSILLALN
ncbi:EamA family transporter [Clostridium neonatale]|uniref:EamA family transporter n=1 Tax=Clostridium neonatale TaxID=137838 RepID=UPI003D33A923